MKKSELFFSVSQVFVDFAMIILAAITAFIVRNVPEIIALQPKLYNYPFRSYFQIVLAIAILFIGIYAIEGLYNIRSTRKFWSESLKVFNATSIGLVIIIVAIFLQRQWFSSRFVILAAWVLAVLYVTIGRLILQSIQKWLLTEKGIGVHRVLLIGTNGKIDWIKKIFRKDPRLGYKVVDHIESGSISEIKEVSHLKGVDEIIVCNPTLTDAEQEKIVDYCAINNVSFKLLPTTLQTAKFEMRTLENEPIIEFMHTPLEGWGKILKRILDVVGAIIIIIIVSPIMLLAAVAIWIESRGPIIYKNKRIGNDGKKFYAYKFRYMKWEYCITSKNENFDEALEYEKKLIQERSIRKGPLYKIKNDPRKTFVGNIIERLSIDELPQLFNVVEGSMSIVGPRPHQEREVDKYKEYHRRLLTIKPGITGLAQISGRSDLDFENEYKMDLYYIENWSFWLDLQILIKTVGVLFRRRKNNK
jgi:exopolysaccharide biosynthesis polyprenyl glycosylphosphotransferase